MPISVPRRISPAGEGPLSRAAIQCAAVLAADRQIAFSVSQDFDELLEVNKSNRDSWDPLMPQFHPDYFDARTAPAFWVKGVNRNGRVVAALSYRRFDLPPGKTLPDALVDLSLFYDDPAKAGVHERVQCSVPVPPVAGSFALSGALWIHPPSRGLGLHSLMWPIGRSITYDLWDVPLVFALVEDVPKMQSVLRFENVVGGIKWSNSYVGSHFDLTLVSWTREKIAADVTAFLSKQFS